MGKKAKGKHRLDWYYKLAKESGYRARSAWKLSMLDGRFRFLESSRAVLDLCAAPGGWMQVAVQRVPVNSLVIGVDFVPIIPIRGAINIQADITKPECMCRIKEHMKRYDCKYFDVILHDGSPNVSGAWDMDVTCQNSLVIDAVKLATHLLRPNGTFLTKVFRSRDFMSVMYCLRQLFESVKYTKPEPSRKESAETYILCRKYKAPSKIDPRLLDIKHLFQGSVELPPKMLNVLRDNKQKRHRDGYEDGITTLRKVSSAANFVWSYAPVDILSSVTSITFADPADFPIKDHDLTTEEVTCLCDDLKVLGKQDFKNLLKWRTQIRKALSHNPDPDSTATEQIENEHKAVEEEDQILNEMEELTCAMNSRKKKHAKALLAKRKAKEKARKLTGMQMDSLEDGYVDPELFSLSLIKCKKDLVTVDTTEYEGELEGSENEEMLDGPKHSSSDLEDSDEERKRYDDLMEELLDEAYEQYVIRKEGRTYQQKRIKKSYGEETQLLEGGEEEDDTMQSKYNSDEDQGDQEGNPLVVPLNNGTELTQDEIVNRWFSQDVFVEAAEEGDFENIESKNEMDIDEPKEKTSIARKVKQNKTAALTVIETSKAAEEDFEIVPAPETETDSSDESEEEEEDVETKAEILAYAKEMMSKKQRESILDDAYNKYMFDDDEGLPKWFLDDEKRHRQPIKPVTKAEIAAMKLQFKEIDARPAKKVAEAKARKKRAAMRKLENVQKKANAISDQTDIPDPLKWKKIDQLYRKAVPKRPQKEYVVAKKGVQVKAVKGKVLVDRRMKKDARKRGMSKAGKGGSKMKGKGYSKASPKN